MARTTSTGGAWKPQSYGPPAMTAKERATFFGFYKKNRSRRLFGFLSDISKRGVNNSILSRYLSREATVNCLVMGCSHWANPRDVELFVKQYNEQLDVAVVALDALPDALVECRSEE